MNKEILVSIPNVWSMRNIIHSGLLDRLRERWSVIIAVAQEGYEDILRLKIPEQNIEILPKLIPNKKWHFMLNVLQGAFAYRMGQPDALVVKRWNERERKGKSLEYKLSKLMVRLGRFRSIYNHYIRIEKLLFKQQLSHNGVSWLTTRKLALGFSTSFVSPDEWMLFRALQLKKIPTTTHILSFDNLTSRGFIPVNEFDQYMVWNRRMRFELQDLYGVPSNRIIETGTPQFDFNLGDESQISRDALYNQLALDWSRPYFVYAANNASLTPDEPLLVKAIIERCKNDINLSTHQWVIRLHPLDSYERWAALTSRELGATINYPWNQLNTSTRHWAIPTVSEIVFLGDLLRFASGVLCMASTSALDSAIVGTPVICVAFNHEASPLENKFYYDAHYSYHYKNISNSGGVRISRNLDELINYLVEAVSFRDRFSQARKDLVEDMCGNVDGHASDRILAALSKLIGGTM